MPELWEQSTLIKQLISGTAPGQTIKTKEQAREGGSDWQDVIDQMNQYAEQAAASDQAALDLQAALGFGQLDVAKGQLGVQQGTLALAQEAQAFSQEDIRNQRLLEAAGLATGPTGAIQLAYMARGQGAPQEEVASIFQNLPFVQELLHGQNVPGFGLPEQLGGESPRTGGGLSPEGPLGGPVPGAGVKGGVLTPDTGGTSGVPGAIEGEGLGVTLPGKKSITRKAFGTLSQFEQEFLGALGQSETGQSAQGFLGDIIKSFIPTRAGGAVSIA